MPAASPDRPRAASGRPSRAISTRCARTRKSRKSTNFWPPSFLLAQNSGCYSAAAEDAMVFFNYATMQMAAKIVYYGPGLCGKTTNLHYIYQHTTQESRGEMVSLE